MKQPLLPGVVEIEIEAVQALHQHRLRHRELYVRYRPDLLPAIDTAKGPVASDAPAHSPESCKDGTTPTTGTSDVESA